MNSEHWMKLALEEAQKAYHLQEVPVGAVLVSDDEKTVFTAHNLKESNFDPTGHAEVICLKKAASALKRWRLSEFSLYVTLEPCMMCTGSLIQARVGKLYFGARDPKGGFITSLEKGLDYPLNHKIDWEEGLLGEESSELLKRFFKERRADRS